MRFEREIRAGNLRMASTEKSGKYGWFTDYSVTSGHAMGPPESDKWPAMGPPETVPITCTFCGQVFHEKYRSSLTDGLT